MRKILLWFFLFCIIWVSQSFAWDVFSFWVVDIPATSYKIDYSTWSLKVYTWATLIYNITAPSWAWLLDWRTIDYIFIGSASPVRVFVRFSNGSYIAREGASWAYTASNAWVLDKDFYHNTWTNEVFFKNTASTYLRYYWASYQFSWSSSSPTWTLIAWFIWLIVWNNRYESWNSLECTTETIPDTQIINIQPTSTWSISEYIENPTDKEYWYSTSLSWENPLLVSLINANNVSWWDEFSYQTWSVSFNSPLSGNTSLILSSSSNIEYIKLLWWYWKHTVITYREDSKTIKDIYDDVNLNDWAEGFGFPVGWSPLVVIQFGYSFFTKNINTLEVYSIWANTTKEVEICYNADDNEYFVDGELWEGVNSPYVELVWDPEPTEVSFTSSWYLFYENWFCLSDFLPFPSGGDLLFDIKTPLGNILTTYPLKNTWLYKYWIGTCSKITTNYHEQAWQYYVKWRYIYKWVIYDIHPNFFAYKITKPESIPSDINPWLDDSPSACGVSDDEDWFLPWVSRFFACISETISMFFKNQYEAVKKIGSLIYEISDIFTTEVENPLAFLIPQASASEPLSWVMTVFDRPENFTETPFWKIEKLMWGAFAIVSLIVVLSLIIMIKGD